VGNSCETRGGGTRRTWEFFLTRRGEASGEDKWTARSTVRACASCPCWNWGSMVVPHSSDPVGSCPASLGNMGEPSVEAVTACQERRRSIGRDGCTWGGECGTEASSAGMVTGRASSAGSSSSSWSGSIGALENGRTRSREGHVSVAEKARLGEGEGTR
jgi:hypothetical protein